MKDELPEAVISCGELVGRRFPRQGPMGGLEVVWTALDALRKHGTIGYNPAPGKGARPKTNHLGNAWVTLVPRDEDRPGKGEIQVARGEIGGAPLYLSGSGTVSGELIQLGLAKTATLARLRRQQAGGAVGAGRRVLRVRLHATALQRRIQQCKEGCIRLVQGL
jgi:hypothetical protein